MSKYKGLIVFIILVIGFYGFSARSQYGWSENYKAEVGSDWVVFDEQKNAADPIYPYTLFNPPVNRLGFVQKSSITELTDGVYYYKKMWADGPIGNSMPTEIFNSFSDCNQNLSGNLREGLTEYKSFTDIEWSRPDDSQYLTSDSDREKVMNSFNKICNILKNS